MRRGKIPPLQGEKKIQSKQLKQSNSFIASLASILHYSKTLARLVLACKFELHPIFLRKRILKDTNEEDLDKHANFKKIDFKWREHTGSISHSHMYYFLKGCPPNSNNSANPLDECSMCYAVNENCIASKQERQHCYKCKTRDCQFKHCLFIFPFLVNKQPT